MFDKKLNGYDSAIRTFLNLKAVSDPNSLNPDPNQDPQPNRKRIQSGSGSETLLEIVKRSLELYVSKALQILPFALL
jgi:hypothetical protein